MSLVSKIAIAYTCGMMTKDNIRKKFIENMEPPTYPVYSWDKPTDLIKVEIGYVEWAGETIKDLQQQNADLVAAVEAAKFWMEGQHSTVSGDCGVCGSESPYHHGQCPKAQVDQALGGE